MKSILILLALSVGIIHMAIDQEEEIIQQESRPVEPKESNG